MQLQTLFTVGETHTQKKTTKVQETKPEYQSNICKSGAKDTAN